MKFSATFFTEIEKSVLKFIWKYKRPWIPKVILIKKNNVKSIIKPDINYTTKP
jgi:hypothetical protein